MMHRLDWAAYICTLRRRFYGWLFGTPTTVLETINTAYLLIWSLAIANDDLVANPLYAGFLGDMAQHVNGKAAILFAIAALFAIVGALRGARRIDSGAAAMQGFALQLSAVLWLAVSLNFFASYPPLNPGALSYGVLSWMCWIAGGQLRRVYLYQQQVHVR